MLKENSEGLFAGLFEPLGGFCRCFELVGRGNLNLACIILIFINHICFNF